MESYISLPCGTVFNLLVIFFVIIMVYWFVTKENIGNYRKYDIFFNCRFTENMIFPSIVENDKNIIFMLSVFTKMLFSCSKRSANFTEILNYIKSSCIAFCGKMSIYFHYIYLLTDELADFSLMALTSSMTGVSGQFESRQSYKKNQ